MIRAMIGFLGALLRLTLLAGVIAGFALLLLRVDGPPRLPARWPSLDEVAFTLQLGGVPNDVLIYLVAQLLWLLLGYLVLACLLEAVATLLDALAAGAAGARRLRRASDAVAPGFVRRAIAGLVMALLTLWLSLRPLATVAAPAPGAPPASAAPLAAVRDEAGTVRLLGPADRAALATPGARHTVVKGDNLVDLALRYYGDAAAWEAIWEANRGRTMTNGRAFDNPSLIFPGDVLVIPERPGARPARLVDHVVQPGDTLRDLADHYYGDEMKWPVIFEANRGRPAPGNRYLVNPDLIWPGMTLKVPLPATAGPAHPAPAAPAEIAPPAVDEARPAADAAPAAPPPSASPASPVGEALGVADPGSPPLAADRPALDAEREAADARAAWARLQAEAEAEARANAVARPPAPAPPASPPSEPAIDDRAAPPAAAPSASPEPATVAPAPAGPITADDLPLAGVLAGAAILAAAVGYREWRRRLAASEPDARLLPFRFPAPPAVDPASGLADQPLAALAAQRRRGVEADPRHAVTTLVLEALGRAGWPAAQVVSLVAGDDELTFRLRLGAPPPADLDPLLEALEEDLAAIVELRPGARDELVLTLGELEPRQAWRAGYALPLTPLATVGQAREGTLSVALDALDGGVLFAGEHAGAALERALLSLAALYPPTALRVALVSDGPLAGALAGLPHLPRPPVSPADPAAGALIEGLREELRRRQAAGDAADGELIVLVVDGPTSQAKSALSELVREGARHGIYTLIALSDSDEIDLALHAACAARLLTGQAAEEDGEPAADDAERAALAQGWATWRVLGDPPRAVRALRMVPADRRALIDTMIAAAAEASNAGATEPTDAAGDGSAAHGDNGGRSASPSATAGLASVAALPPWTPTSNGHRAGTNGNGHAGTNGVGAEGGLEPADATAAAAPDAGEAALGDGAAGASLAASGIVAASVAADLTGQAPAAAPAERAAPIDGTPESPAPSSTDAGPDLDGARPHATGPAGGAGGVDVPPLRSPDAGEAALVPPADEPAFGPRPGMLQLRLFGTPRLFDADGQVIDFGRGQLGLRVLTYLALQREAGAVADSIVEHVWPLPTSDDEEEPTGSSPAEKVRKATKRVLGILAARLPAGGEAVTFRGSVYRLNPAVVWCDATAVEACLRAARRRVGDEATLPLMREALGYYAAPLAQEVAERWFDPVWLGQEREHHQGLARRAALAAAAALARREDYAGAAAVYQKLRNVAIVDDELAQLELICQALRGERALIAQSYDEHVAALARLGMRPWQATRSLYEQLMTRPVTPEQRTRLEGADRR